MAIDFGRETMVDGAIMVGMLPVFHWFCYNYNLSMDVVCGCWFVSVSVFTSLTFIGFAIRIDIIIVMNKCNKHRYAHCTHAVLYIETLDW